MLLPSKIGGGDTISVISLSEIEKEIKLPEISYFV